MILLLDLFVLFAMLLLGVIIGTGYHDEIEGWIVRHFDKDDER